MRILFLLLMTAVAGVASAQSVSGIVKDNQGATLTGATAALVRAKDTFVLKMAVTSAKGDYAFSSVSAGDYRVMVSHIGHSAALSQPFSVASADVVVPTITAVKAAADLQGVVVTARKPMIEVRADKTVLNVENTINAAGSDALELLRKSPGVTVDKDENLTVNGKNGVQVYIDGRPSPLSGSDLANFLKSTQSSQVEAIEIITNPSAKYEAAGNAGIINIRLKKNKAYGTNGSANAGYAIGVYAKYNAGVGLNYRNKAVNIYGNYSYSQGPNDNYMQLYRTVADTVFDQKGNMIFDNLSHNFKIGADYTLSKTSSIGVLANATIANPAMHNNSRTLIGYQPTGAVDRVLDADNTSNLKRDNYNVNLNYNYTGATGKTLTINADRGYYKNNNDQYQPNFYYAADGKTFQRSVITQMIAPTTISINSAKVDWEQNFGGGKMGIGGKLSMVDTDNDFRQFNLTGSNSVLDRDRSNRFTYKENITAGYINWNKAYKGFMVQAGLRVENTNAEGRSVFQKNMGSGIYRDTISGFDRNYTNFFPSAAITFNKNPMNQWTVSYSRRIDRPAYQDLNPFEMKLNEYSYMKGNINLMPQFTNSFELTNVYKYRLTTKLGYSHIADLFTQIPDTIEKTKSFMTKRNLATQRVVSLNVSYPFQYKAYSVFANVSANYSMNRADFGPGRIIDINAFGATAFAQNTLRFAKVWTAEVTGVYVAPSVWQGTFRSKGMGGVDLGLMKQIFKGNGTLKVAYTDVLRTFRFRGSSDFAGQLTKVNVRWEATQFKVNFTWRFGSTTVKAAKQKGTGSDDESKRAAQGSGGGGIGVGN